MIIQVVRFESALDFEAVLEVARERAPEFEKLPGLLQKYYTRAENGAKVAGIYVWDSEESMQEYRNSGLAATIPKAYQVQGAPEVEIYEVEFSLR